MGRVVEPQHSGNEPDFRVIKQRFIDLNRLRLQRIQADLRPLQRDFLALLPLLFHVNHPLLPGYVSGKAPAGLPDYSPGRDAQQAAKRIAKGFELKRRAYRRFDIQGLFLMGSTGTIAYSEQSDFDVWVCHDPNLSQKQLDELQQKTYAIEQWASDNGVTVSIFLVDPDRFRQGHYTRLSQESSGSALHFLLLEEFYRTSVSLAGRYPLWWMVPPEKETEYDDYVTELKRKRFVHSRDHIDLGGLAQIPAEEFYGATLWLLYKGIDSPYKSVLKILLMEIYASEFPNIDLLGMRFKKAIYAGHTELGELDPYLMMMQRVESYLSERGEMERLELARRCFYLKVGEPLSQGPGDNTVNWRREKLSALCADWGWHSSQWFMLDNRENWKLDRVKSERNALISELMRSYRFLSDFARNHAGATSLIKPAELNVLGRKLFAAFERKAGKIDVVYKGITSDLHEERICIHRLAGQASREVWAAYGGPVTERNVEFATPLRRARSLIELLAWCYFNRILNSNTLIAMYAHGSDLNDREVSAIVGQLMRTFGSEKLQLDNVDDFRQPVQVREVATFINVGVDPFAAHARQGRHLTSSRTDALKYGGLLENLALTIDQLIVSSWKEVLTFRYQGLSGLMECLRDYFAWSPPSQGRRPPPINAVSFSSMRGNAIAHRLEELFNDIISVYYDVAASRRTHYILAAERNYYVLNLKKDSLHYTKLSDIQALYNHLSASHREFNSVVFDRETLVKDVLPAIYTNNHRERIQYFYRSDGQHVEVFVLDERGSLFYQRIDVPDYICLLKHFQRFIRSVHERMRYLAHESGHDLKIGELEVYKLERNYEGDWIAEQHATVRETHSLDLVNLQVIVELVDGQTNYTVYCDDQEFSTLELGTELYRQVADHIVANRSGQRYYPIYITDLDLPRALQGDDIRDVQTIHYLQHKRDFEDKLNAELSRRQ